MAPGILKQSWNLLSLYGRIAVRTERDDADRDSEIILHELDVVLEGLREVFFLADAAQVALPSRKFGVDRVYSVGNVEWQTGCSLAADFIFSADLDCVEVVQTVGFHHDEVCHTVEHD